MAAKTDKKQNDTLPLKAEDLTPSSAITYNNEVVAIIAGLAANEVEGIAGMCNVSGSLMRLPWICTSSWNTVSRFSGPRRMRRKTSARPLNP